MNKFLNSKLVKTLTSEAFDIITTLMMWGGGAVFLLMIVAALIAKNDDNITPVAVITIIKLSGIIGVFGALLNFLQFLLRRYIVVTKQKQQDSENLQHRILREREEKEQEFLRSRVDLVLEKIDYPDRDKITTFFRLVLKRGDQSKEYLCFKGVRMDCPEIIRPVTQFTFRDSQYYNSSKPGEWLSEFPEKALPTLKLIIEHYQKYGNLEPAPPVITPVEAFVISRPEVEPPPDLTSIDTVHELAPLLIEAEKENNHYAVNKILNKMEQISAISTDNLIGEGKKKSKFSVIAR